MILSYNQWRVLSNLGIKLLIHSLLIIIINFIYFLLIGFDVFRLSKFLNPYKVDGVDFWENFLVIKYWVPIILSYLYYFIFIFRQGRILFKIISFITVLILALQPYSYYIKYFLGK